MSLAREPLVHFALLGTALLGLYRWAAPPAPTREIVVSGAVVQALRAEHVQQTGVWPTAAEDAALVARFVDDEMLFREARRLGLDGGDLIVRRRLVQKMEFLTEGLDAAPEPEATALQAYLEAHADRYAVPARVTFTHVFARGERPPPEGAALATGWADALRRGADPATLGDPFVRGRSLAGASEAEVAAVFGAPFAARVMGLPLGAWSGPVVSSYGQHLVRVTARSPGHAATLADVHAAVAHDWTEERRAAARRAALDRLRAAYAVRVEPPAPGVVAAR